MRPILATICLGVTVAQALPAPEDRPAFKLSISLDHSTVAPNAEVAINVTITNLSEKEMFLFRTSRGMPPYRFSIVDQKHRPVPLTRLGQALVDGRTEYTNEKGERRVMLGGGAPKAVPPKGELNDLFPISYFVHLSRPGRYTIRLQRQDPYTELAVESNPITLIVTKPK